MLQHSLTCCYADLVFTLCYLQVLSTIVRVLLQDLEMKKALGPNNAPFDQRPYFRSVAREPQIWQSRLAHQCCLTVYALRGGLDLAQHLLMLAAFRIMLIPGWSGCASVLTLLVHVLCPFPVSYQASTEPAAGPEHAR